MPKTNVSTMNKPKSGAVKQDGKPTAPSFNASAALLRAFIANEKINQYLLAGLPAAAWRAEPPGGNGRTVAAIVAHMHNVRVMWLKVSAKGSKIPEQLDRHTVTVAQAKKALKQSAAALTSLLKESLAAEGRISNFRPDVAGFFCYLIAHDAHHRGQVTMLARQLGHGIPQEVMFGMWEWNKRGNDK
jgi:uncharacterized damage-inducible protein DinB